MLHCSVDGYPIPFTYWYKDNEPLQENPRVQISGNIPIHQLIYLFNIKYNILIQISNILL